MTKKRKMTDKSNNFGIALYYPFINIQNIEWLKCALLYWDANGWQRPLTKR
jgi:hypothetical protein